MNLDIGVVSIRFARQQGFDLPTLGIELEGLQLVDRFALDLPVILGFREFDKRDGILEVAVEA